MKLSSTIIFLSTGIFSIINLQCKLEDSTIIDSSVEAVFISSIKISPQIINTDTIFVNGGQTPDDTISLEAVVMVRANKMENNLSVSATVTQVTEDRQLAAASLSDSGILPDSIKGDSVYTGIVGYTIKRSYYGKINVVVSGYSSTSNSTTVTSQVTIIRNNLPPIVDSADVPDTLFATGSPQIVTITARVHDLDGSSDIRQVLFNSFLMPDSINSRGTISMFDDGGKSNNGTNGNTDELPGDGIYTVSITFPGNISPQIRRFVFEARDQANAQSNLIVHDIIIR